MDAAIMMYVSSKFLRVLRNFSTVAFLKTHIYVMYHIHIGVLELYVCQKGGISLVLTRYLRSTSCLIVFLAQSLVSSALCKPSRPPDIINVAAGK